MNRFVQLLMPLCVLLNFFLLSCAEKQQKTDMPPNIIVLLTDDQAFRAIGYNRMDEIRTPNMDELAAEGVIFRNNYATTSICMASRANIMMGMYEYKTGCNFMHGPLQKEKFSLSYPELLQAEGYYTGFAGKFGFAVVEDVSTGEKDNDYSRLPVNEFDWWAGGKGQTSYETKKNKYLAKYADSYPHSTRAYGAACQDFIKESLATGKPFCLSLYTKAPHGPLTPDPAFDNVYEHTVFSLTSNYWRQAGKHLATQSKLGRHYLRSSAEYNEENYQENLRKYYQLIYGVDYALGMIREELERQGIADNTVIILTSDNGYCLGAHGFGGKVLPYEEASKTPLVIFDPRSKSIGKGYKTNALTGNVDVAATVLDLAGLTIPDNMDGISMLPNVENPETRIRQVLPVFQAWGTAPNLGMSVMTEEWKYIFWYFGDRIEPAGELFNLYKDPMEMENVINDPENTAILRQMMDLYDKEIQKWKNEAVSTGNYKDFAVLFDPKVSWEDKKDLIPESFWEVYAKELSLLEYEGDPADYNAVIEKAENN